MKALWYSRMLSKAIPITLLLVAVACGPGAAPTPTATVPPPTPTRAAVAPTATPTTAPVAGVATPTPTRAPVAVVATPTPTMAAAPGSITAKEGVKRGGVFRKMRSTTVSIFDMHQSTTETNTYAQSHRFDGLLRMNPVDGNKTIIPDLASSWEVSKDGLAYTYHLRPGVKFHDGSPLTADDVVASYNKIISPPKGVLSPRKDLFAAVTKVEAVDPLTVRFVLKQPSAIVFVATATGWNVIVPKKTLEKYNYDLKTVTDYPGTGPFRFVSWAVGEKVVSERNPEYWNKGLPYLDRVEVLDPTGGNEAIAVMTGKAEYGAVAPDLFQRAKDQGFQVTSVQTGNPRAIYLNVARPNLADPRVRRAMHLVVNRQAIFQAGMASGTGLAFGGPWLPVGGAWDTPVEEIEKLPGYRQDKTADIAEAKRLMAVAGYANGIKNLDVLTRTPTGFQTEIVAPALLDQLSVLGITGNIRPTETAAWATETARGGWDISIGYMNLIVDDPAANWAAWFKTGAGYNYGGYANPKFDQIVAQLDATTDRAQRLELVRQGNAILGEDPPMIIPAWLVTFYVTPPYVKDLYNTRMGLYDGGPLKMDTAWMDK